MAATRGQARLIITIIASMLAVLVLGLFGGQYEATRAAAAAERANTVQVQKFCALLLTLDLAYQTVPPTTPTGQEVARNIQYLVEEFRCPNA